MIITKMIKKFNGNKGELGRREMATREEAFY
jgi:hypothetical protein